MGATQSSGTKLSLADRRYRVNSPRADSLLVQQRHSGRKLGGVAVEPRDNPQCSSTTKESFQLNDDTQQAIIFDMETLEAGDKNRRRKSGSNGSTNSNETLNRQNQNLQMSRIENSASVLTILLTRTQRVLIENSWKRAKKGAADGGVGSRVFHTVLTAQPDIKLLFGLEKVPQVQQMRRGFEDERLLRKRFSASLMGIRGRPLVSKINHNVLHQSFGSLDDYSFPFSSNNFNDNPDLSSSNNGIPVYKVNGRVRACSSISPLVAETFTKDENQQTIPRPALTAIKLLLDSTATSGDEHLIVDKDSIPTSTQLLYARHSFSNFVTDEKNGEEQRNAAFDVSQKLLGVAQTDVDSTNDKSSPSQIRRLSAL
uniref:Uncharacterized protein n=1 Tax=Meloidogyne javanica TaxID=6303 RepID=A0A915LFY4_MELJA